MGYVVAFVASGNLPEQRPLVWGHMVLQEAEVIGVIDAARVLGNVLRPGGGPGEGEAVAMLARAVLAEASEPPLDIFGRGRETVGEFVE